MNTLTITLALSSLFFVTTAMAGAGHNHGQGHDDHAHDHAPAPVNQNVAEQKAEEVIGSLIKRDKIDKSWATIKAKSIEKKMFNDRPEWVVIFLNEKITDTDKQTLYVFLTIDGEYIAANHTGN